MDELDIRRLPLRQQLDRLDERFAALPPGDTFVLVVDAEPVTLMAAFDVDHAEAHRSTVLEATPGLWRIGITRLTASDLPRVLCNTQIVAAQASSSAAAGAVWRLQLRQRHLDANIIHLPAHDSISLHIGSDLDVLILVLVGSGTMSTEAGDVSLATGSLGWLPRRSVRAVTADGTGLTYFTVHQRRPGMTIGKRPPDAP